MTYGIKLINGFDEETVGDFPAMYNIASGGADKKSNYVPAGEDPLGYSMSPTTYPAYRYSLLNYPGWSNGTYTLDPLDYFYCTDSVTWYEARDISDRTFPVAGFDDPYDPLSVCFIELPDAGIIEATSTFIPYTHIGALPTMVVFPMPPDNTSFPFFWAGSDTSGLSATEQYGMKIADESGQTVFDNRFPIVGVKDILIIPEADMQDVVENGTTKTYTTRVPVPNVKIHTPLFRCFAYGDYETPGGDNRSDLDIAKLRQIDSSTIEISRESFTRNSWTRFGNNQATGNPTSGSYIHDVFLFLA